MATTIVTKKGSGAPAASDLVEGELAVDTTNGRLYTENSSAAVVELGSNPSGNITFGDNGKAIFGAGSDLEILSNGTDGLIRNGNATGEIRMESDDRIIFADRGFNEVFAVFNDDDDVKLYHDGNQKLATTATGIDVTGTATIDGLTVNSTNNSGNTGTPTIVLKDLDVTVSAGQFTGAVEFETSDTNNPGVNSYIRSVMTGTGAGGSLKFGTGFAGSLADRVLIGDNGDISFYEDTGTTAKLFWDASAEALGIGTTPVYDFDILDTSETILGIRASDSSGTNVAIRFQDAGTGTGVNGLYVGRASALNYFWTYEAEPLLFGTSATERMRIDASGNVGIGVSPISTAKLDINISTNARGYFASNIGEVGAGNFALQVVDATGVSLKPLGFRAEDIRFATLGGERMRIDSSGNLLVGTTTADGGYDESDGGASPAFMGASIGGAANGSAFVSRRAAPLQLNRQANDGDIAVFRKDGTTIGSIGVQAGDLNIGTTDCGLLFNDGTPIIIPTNVSTGVVADASIDLGYSAGRFKDLYLSGNVIASGTPSSSVVGVRVNNSGNNFDLINTSCGTATTTKTHILFTNGNGNVGSIQTNGSATSYNTSSDYRLKENVVAISGATERLKQLKPSRFNFIADADTTVDGFLAHEVADIVPEAITGAKDAMRDEEYEVTPAVLDDDGNVITEAVMGTRSVPDYQGIDQSKLVPLLVATIQELEARIAALES